MPPNHSRRANLLFKVTLFQGALSENLTVLARFAFAHSLWFVCAFEDILFQLKAQLTRSELPVSYNAFHILLGFLHAK